jgi:hypothetical protein
MNPALVNYLNSISHEQQFPALRCAMAEMVYMYGKTALSGVKAINHANDSIQRQTAVDILNAALSSSRKRVSNSNGLSPMLGRKRCGAKRSH